MTDSTTFEAASALAVDAQRLARRFPGGAGVSDLTLQLREGEFTTLLGPSGSGKTTSLRLIAGFERPDAGVLFLQGVPVAGPAQWIPPERRGLGMVFQDYALFPHMTVGDNISYGLTRSTARAPRVTEMLALVGLGGFEARSVHELSGGEQQRVALARALAPRPNLLLLDEPFSSLDASLRGRMRAEVCDIVKRSGTTALLVTHDQEEALSISDRVAFMWRGRVEQVGTPGEIYLRPATLHVAESIGDANLLRVLAHEGYADTAFGRLRTPAGATQCAVVIRPEDVQVSGGGTTASLVAREYYGHDQVLRLRLPDGSIIRARIGAHEAAPVTETFTVSLRRDPVVLAETGD